MANFAYTGFKRALLAGEMDLDAPNDIRVLLVMTNTTADTEADATTFAGFTTLDEFDGAGYTSGGVALTGEAVAADNANDRGEFDANDAAWTGISAGTRSIQAAIVYKFVTNLNASIPMAYIDTGGFPFAANGGDITIQWNAEGIIQAT